VRGMRTLGFTCSSSTHSRAMSRSTAGVPSIREYHAKCAGTSNHMLLPVGEMALQK
jgi:hypothetical protein